jgi:hypothetical protein
MSWWVVVDDQDSALCMPECAPFAPKGQPKTAKGNALRSDPWFHQPYPGSPFRPKESKKLDR